MSFDGSKMSSLQSSFQKTFIVVFLPFTIAFILSCLFRAMNAVLIPTLVQLTHVRPDQLGLLNATFFLAYALFQIPLGVLLDNYGAKNTQASLFIVGGAGLILAGITTNIWIIALGHALLGIGMSGGLMAAFKIIVQWFPIEKIPMLNGIMMTFGGIGILLSATPTEIIASTFGWTVLNVGFGFLAIAAAILIFAIVPDSGAAIQKNSISAQLKGLASIYKTKSFWKIAPITASVLSSFMAIHGLWVENWLRTISNASQSTIDNYLVVMAVAMTASLLSTGYIAKIARYYDKPLENILGVLVIAYVFVELGIIFISDESLIFWILLCLISQIFNLSYAILTQNFQKTYSGRANTALNVIVFFATFFIQYIIGFAINFLSHFYTLMVSYKISFTIPILLQFICTVWFYMQRSNKLTI